MRDAPVPVSPFLNEGWPSAEIGAKLSQCPTSPPDFGMHRILGNWVLRPLIARHNQPCVELVQPLNALLDAPTPVQNAACSSQPSQGLQNRCSCSSQVTDQLSGRAGDCCLNDVALAKSGLGIVRSGQEFMDSLVRCCTPISSLQF